MASRAHQLIAELIARKMILAGYEVVSFEGDRESEQIKLKLPPKILRHRPDLIGIKMGSIAIGEAKTANDLGLRTQEQLKDFTDNTNWPNQIHYEVFFGLPLSIEQEFHTLLKKVNINTKSLVILTVPDRLLPDNENNNI